MQRDDKNPVGKSTTAFSLWLVYRCKQTHASFPKRRHDRIPLKMHNIFSVLWPGSFLMHVGIYVPITKAHAGRALRGPFTRNQ